MRQGGELSDGEIVLDFSFCNHIVNPFFIFIKPAEAIYG
jgi:hypothetical protein